MIYVVLRSLLLTSIKRVRLTGAVVRASVWKDEVKDPDQQYQWYDPKEYCSECEYNVYVDDLNKSVS